MYLEAVASSPSEPELERPVPGDLFAGSRPVPSPVTATSAAVLLPDISEVCGCLTAWLDDERWPRGRLRLVSCGKFDRILRSGSSRRLRFRSGLLDPSGWRSLAKGSAIPSRKARELVMGSAVPSPKWRELLKGSAIPSGWRNRVVGSAISQLVKGFILKNKNISYYFHIFFCAYK